MPDPVETLEDRCEKYLEQKQATLWADWVISDPARRTLAARWLATQIRGVQRISHPSVQPVPEHYGRDGGDTRRKQPHYSPHEANVGPAGIAAPTKEQEAAALRPSARITHGQQAERW